MAENYLQIRKLVFRGQNKESVLSFSEGSTRFAVLQIQASLLLRNLLISCWEERSYGKL